jgi:TonB family protein
MPVKTYPPRSSFGLLPEPEGRSASFITSAVVNGCILVAVLLIGLIVKPKIEEHKYEQTELILPTKEPPPPPKIKIPPPPKVEMPKPPEVKLEEPKFEMPKPKPEPKPVQMEAKVTPLPTIKAAKPAIVLAPQPKAALQAAAMPAQSPQVKPSTAPVHLGETFGVTPNPNATRPATVAAIGNPYGGMNGPAVAPHGVVGSTGIGNGLKSGSNAGVVGKVASAGIPGSTGNAPTGGYGNVKVASAGIPTTTTATLQQVSAPSTPTSTQVEVSIPKPVYTDEARQLRIEGTVVLRVTFFANGQIQVVGVLRGLGHGLDEQAKRAVQQGRVIRPATVNGRPMDSTTNITILFQLA